MSVLSNRRRAATTAAPLVPPTAPAGRVAAQMRAAYDYNREVDAQVQAGKFTPASAPYADGTTSLEDLKTLSQRHGIPIASVPSTLGGSSNGGTFSNPALNSLATPPSRVIAGSPTDAALALNNAAAADRQAPLGTAPGSSRIVRDANPDPNPVVNRATDARGNTTTTFANGTTATSSNAPTGDGGIYVDGKPVAHGADGSLVADLSRAGGGTTPAQRQAPATAIASGAGAAQPPTGSLFHPPTYRNDALNALTTGVQGGPPPAVAGSFFHPATPAVPPAAPLPAGVPGVASAPGTAKQIHLEGGLALARDAAEEAGLPTGNPGVFTNPGSTTVADARPADNSFPDTAPTGPVGFSSAPPPPRSAPPSTVPGGQLGGATPRPAPVPTAPALAATVTPPGAPPPSGPPPPLNLPSAGSTAQPFDPQPLTLTGTATQTIPGPVDDEEERRRRLAAQ